MPALKLRGRPRKTEICAATNALFSLLRTGGPWRYLRAESFPLRSTVCTIFRTFQRDGVWGQIWTELHMALREACGRGASPVAGNIHSQARKAAEKGAARPRMKTTQWAAASKKAKGRKLHALVDIEGFPLRVIVHAAGLQNRDETALVVDKIHQRFNWLALIWADSGYNARRVTEALARPPGLGIDIVNRSDGVNGFVVLQRRWVVERTFSWFGRNRRLAKDFKNLADTLGSFAILAVIQLGVRRPARG